MYFVPREGYYPFYNGVDPYLMRRQRAYERAQREALEKRRREELWRRQIYEQEMARRREEEYQRRQEALVRERWYHGLKAYQDDDDDDENDDYVQVQHNGRLYQVPKSQLNDFERLPKHHRAQPTSPVSSHPIHYESSQPQSSMDGKRNEAIQVGFPTLKKPSLPRRRKKVTVIVEDASDDEKDENRQQNVWRNRHPSPGESWMEPINVGF